jgi:pimeloyl-ACP methyl ester carboxylesterase
VALPWVFGARFLNTHPELLAEEGLKALAAQAPGEAAQERLLQGFLTLEDLRPHLKALTLPALVLYGEEDLLFPKAYAQALAESLGARLACPAHRARCPPRGPSGLRPGSPDFLGGGICLAIWRLDRERPWFWFTATSPARRGGEAFCRTPPDGARLLAPDLPGFGETPAPEGFVPSIPAYAEALRGFLREMGVEEAVLVGHSLGGAVVMEAATEKTRGLVLLNSAPPSGLETPEAYYPILESYRYNREALAQALAAMAPTHRPPWFPELVDCAQRMHPAHYQGNARALAAWRASRAYPGPVLVLYGTLDPIVTRAMAEETKAFFPKGRLMVLEGVGHSLNLEDPARLKAILEDFLKEVAP